MNYINFNLPFMFALHYFNIHTGNRGEKGPVQVREIEAFEDATSAFLEATQSEGFTLGDVNAEEMTNSKFTVVIIMCSSF